MANLDNKEAAAMIIGPNTLNKQPKIGCPRLQVMDLAPSGDGFGIPASPSPPVASLGLGTALEARPPPRHPGTPPPGVDILPLAFPSGDASPVCPPHPAP